MLFLKVSENLANTACTLVKAPMKAKQIRGDLHNFFILSNSPKGETLVPGALKPWPLVPILEPQASLCRLGQVNVQSTPKDGATDGIDDRISFL